MFYQFTYDTVKRFDEDRRRRSLARYEASRRGPIDSYVRGETSDDADVIELVFGTACAPETIGA